MSDARCLECGAEASKRCGRCKAVFYCSAACQRAGWPAHKAKCGIVVPAPPAPAATTPSSTPNVRIDAPSSTPAAASAATEEAFVPAATRAALRAAAKRCPSLAAIMNEEAMRWSAGGRGACLRRDGELSTAELALAQQAVRSPAKIAEAIGPFVVAALGAADAAAHDTAARALKALVMGAGQRQGDDGEPSLDAAVLSVVNACMGSLHQLPATAIATPSALRAAPHEIMTFEDDSGHDHLFFALCVACASPPRPPWTHRRTFGPRSAGAHPAKNDARIRVARWQARADAQRRRRARHATQSARLAACCLLGGPRKEPGQWALRE